jgi:hypothetical protein
MYVVRNKILITATLALIGSTLALIGGGIKNPITIIGLVLVASSPVVSFIIVYFWYSRRWYGGKSKERSSPQKGRE